MLKFYKNDEIKTARAVENAQKKEWRETNVHTKYNLYKTIGEALAQKFGYEVPYVKLQSNRCIVFTSENNVDFVIQVTQKRNKVNYKENTTEVFEHPKDEDFNDEEWLQEIEQAMVESGD